jgi:hypothetical protein
LRLVRFAEDGATGIWALVPNRLSPFARFSRKRSPENLLADFKGDGWLPFPLREFACSATGKVLSQKAIPDKL